jgi:hypothetical protein
MKRGLAVLVVLAFPSAAAAQSAIVVGEPRLGVAGSGEAVVAWSGPSAVFASVRAPGGRFATGRRLDSRRGAGSPALAVNRAGDGAAAWRRATRDGRPHGRLRAARRHAGRAFGPSLGIRGSARGFEPSVAMSDRRTAALAFLRTRSRRCGAAVLVSVARAGGGFARPRRVSPACARAADVHVTLWSGGDGLVVWRSGRALYGATLDNGRIARRLLLTSGPVATVGYGLAPGPSGALVAWRAGAEGPVVTADVGDAGVEDVRRVSDGGRIAGVPEVAIGRDGTAVVTWQEGLTPPRVVVAERPAGADDFGVPVVADPCGAVDASRTYAVPALAGAKPSVVFQSACMNRFDLGTDYGIALTTRRDDGTWSPQPLSRGTYSTSAAVGGSETGEFVAAWKESGRSGGLRTAIIDPA